MLEMICFALIVLCGLSVMFRQYSVAIILFIIMLALTLCSPWSTPVLEAVMPLLGYYKVIIVFATLLLVLIAYVKFTGKKRAYKDWMSRDEKTSLKRRLEKD